MQMLNGREERNNGGLSMVINCCLVIEHLKPCLGGGPEMTDCPGQQHHTSFIGKNLLLPLAALHRFAETLIHTKEFTCRSQAKSGR